MLDRRQDCLHAASAAVLSKVAAPEGGLRWIRHLKTIRGRQANVAPACVSQCRQEKERDAIKVVVGFGKNRWIPPHLSMGITRIVAGLVDFRCGHHLSRACRNRSLFTHGKKKGQETRGHYISVPMLAYSLCQSRSRPRLSRTELGHFQCCGWPQMRPQNANIQRERSRVTDKLEHSRLPRLLVFMISIRETCLYPGFSRPRVFSVVGHFRLQSRIRLSSADLTCTIS